MLRFLRENWLWIALPFVVVLAGMPILIGATGGETGGTTFIYNVF